MKQNKSLKDVIKSSKLDFVSYSKYFLWTIWLFILSSIVIVSVIGLKLGFDFVGGTVVEVIYGVDANGTVYNEQQANDIIETAISGFNIEWKQTLETSLYQTEESSFGDKVVYKLVSNKRMNYAELTALKNDIFEMFNSYDESNIIQSQYVKVFYVDGNSGDIVLYSAITLGVGLVLLALWILIRYGLSQALTSIITCLVNIAMIFTFVAICRLRIDTTIIASIFTTFILTILGLIIYFDKIKETLKNDKYKGSSRKDYANATLKEFFVEYIIIFGLALICMILVSGFGVAPIRSFGLPALFGVILTGLSIYFAVPYFYTFINIGKQRK